MSTDDIGVITPFKAQHEKIEKRLKEENLGGVEVGTVELFQGREKNITILSTVRSKVLTLDDQLHLGSLSHPKRLNVAITRAKSLMIVIGDAKTLKRDKNWHFVLKTCQLEGSLTGKEFIDKDQLDYCGINLTKKCMDSSTLLNLIETYHDEKLIDSFNSMSLINFLGFGSNMSLSYRIHTGMCDESDYVAFLNDEVPGYNGYVNYFDSDEERSHSDDDWEYW